VRHTALTWTVSPANIRRMDQRSRLAIQGIVGSEVMTVAAGCAVTKTKSYCILSPTLGQVLAGMRAQHWDLW